MKVLLLNAKPSLVNALAARAGVETIGVWPRRHDFAHLLAELDQSPEFYCGGPKFSLRVAWQLRRVIERERPDVVHAFYGRALAHTNLAVTGLRRRPKVVSFRGITSPLSRLDPGDWLSYRHPHVDAHACESHAVRDVLIGSGIAADRCHVTYNSMYFPPLRRRGRAGLAQFDVPADAFVVGTVATMRRVKGIDLLLSAAIECADLSDTYWVLFGTVVDPAVERLATDPRIRDRVRLAGHRPDASELISGADLFVMPSRAEALCQALIEAMHQGVCPVVSDAGGMKEVVRHGVDGLVVAREDITALATAIRTLHSNRDLATQYAASARARVAIEFTPEKVAEHTMTIYEHLRIRCEASSVTVPFGATVSRRHYEMGCSSNTPRQNAGMPW